VKSKKAIFIINLLQDINILRPLIYLASRDLKLPTELIITSAFNKRDIDNIWRREITQLVKDTCSLTFWVQDDFEAYKVLDGKRGIIFAASESDLSAHAPTHNLFKMAPSGLLKVTLQHGFECVGFLQSKQHIIAHGEHITFGADVVCGWSELSRLTSMAESQKSKLLVTGPTAAIQQPSTTKKKPYGLICENLHSVRLSASGNLKMSFMDMFARFSLQLRKNRMKVALRPHPGGQYVIKNNIKMEPNVELNNAPMYKVDLSQYAYGVSAPSSVIIDMILAGIPVAVWRDDNGVMDTDNYYGLTQVSNAENLMEFTQDATLNPEKYIERQRVFLKRSGLKTQPQWVYKQYRSLIESACKTSIVPLTDPAVSPIERVMYIANGYIPTLQLSFIKPLAALVENGSVVSDFISGQQIGQAFLRKESSILSVHALQTQLENFQPSVIVFCRYSGPNAVFIRLWAKQHHVPVIFHIDDDLLHVPISLGAGKFNIHNSASRRKTVRYLLDNSDLVYCSTKNIENRMAQLNTTANRTTGDIYCSGEVINNYESKPTTLIGYMASADHAHNLRLILPALIRILDKHPKVNFELFGSMPQPEQLQRFGSRISIAPPIADYTHFLKEFASREWDVGLCPLVPIPFNKMKAETKWVEYSSCGIAVIASKNTAYDRCCADGCGLLVETEDDWYDAMDTLIVNTEKKSEIVENAQRKITEKYSIDSLRDQVLSVFSIAKTKLET
jgi:glycosyltransferase involved in cell wall biosynthesis